jgi:hypothetical protein
MRSVRPVLHFFNKLFKSRITTQRIPKWHQFQLAIAEVAWVPNRDIVATGKAPPNDLESAILGTLPPGNYTAIVRGFNNTSGNALIEVYGLD